MVVRLKIEVQWTAHPASIAGSRRAFLWLARYSGLLDTQEDKEALLAGLLKHGVTLT